MVNLLSMTLQAAGALWRLMLCGTPNPGEAPSGTPGFSALGVHLLALRKYFLLGAGDFWHAFLLQVC